MDSIQYFLLEVKGQYKVNSKVNFISGINFPLYLPVGMNTLNEGILRSVDMYLEGTLGYLIGVSFNTSPNTEVSLTYNHVGFLKNGKDEWKGMGNFNLGVNYLF